MDFINPNPLCFHLTRHSSLNTPSFRNNSAALALVSVAGVYTDTHVQTHMCATNSRVRALVLSAQPPHTHTHWKVKPNGASTGARVDPRTRTHTCQTTGLFPNGVLIHSTDPKLYVWRENLARDVGGHPVVQRYEPHRIINAAVHRGQKTLFYAEEWRVINPVLHCVISSCIIVWQPGGGGQQPITLSPVQYVRLDSSSVTAEVALQEWHALCLYQNDQASAVSGPSQPERSDFFFSPSPKTLFSLGCF